MTGSGFEITCVNKNHLGVIVRIGGVGWSLSAEDAIRKLLSRQLGFTILLNNQYRDLGIRGSHPDVYLAVEPEGYALHDIADIPSC